MKLVWNEQAKRDVLEFFSYIGVENLIAARRMRVLVFAQVRLLARFPEMGRKGRVRGTRELVVSDTPYIVAYRVGEDEVTVLSIWHGARRWPKSF